MSRVDNLRSPQPLREDFTHPNPDVVNAYNMCYLAEHVVDPQAIQSRLPLAAQDETARTKLINIRILGYLLSQSCFLSDAAISEVARGIISYQEETEKDADETDVEALNKLGEFYRDFLLRPFCKRKGETPDVSESPSSNSSDVSLFLTTSYRTSISLAKEEVDRMLAETPKRYSTARKLAMQREDHRCIVTRKLDRQRAVDLRDLAGEIYKGVVVYLTVCHIFAEPTNMDVEGKESEDSDGYNASQWTLLKRLGYTDIANDFANIDKVYSLDNIMMMVHDLRYHFDSLSMWFEPIEDACGRYRLCTPWMLPHGVVTGQEIAFQSTDPRLPLPNREYLAIHAACCRVAHLSGALFLLDPLEEDTGS